MNEQVTTADELNALPDGSRISDTMGDEGLIDGGSVCYPETVTLSRAWVAKHYLPATVLYRPDRPALTITAEQVEAAADALPGINPGDRPNRLTTARAMIRAAFPDAQIEEE